MKLLGIDSSSLVASVAVVTDDVLTAEYTVDFKKTHSQTLLPMLDEIVKLLDLDLDTIDAIAVENEVADNMYQRSELDYLIYNDPLAYAELMLNGDPETYLKTVTECEPLDS